jgi:hypothetical protein
MGSSGVGSKCGGCPWCRDLQGIIVYPSSTKCYYPGAVRYLPVGDPLRGEFRQEFAGDPALAAIADLPPPELITTEQAMESGRRVEQGESKAADEPYTSVSPFYTYFETDVVKCTTADACHAIGGTIEQLLCLVLCINGTQMSFKEAYKAYEMGDLGRWGNGFPFRATPASRKMVHELLQTLVFPSKWSRIKHLVEKPTTSKVTCSSMVMLCIVSTSNVYIVHTIQICAIVQN